MPVPRPFGPMMKRQDPRARKYSAFPTLSPFMQQEPPPQPPPPATPPAPQDPYGSPLQKFLAPGAPTEPMVSDEEYNKTMSAAGYDQKKGMTTTTMSTPGFNFEKEYDALAAPQRAAVERPDQPKYAIAGQILAGLGDVFAAKGGQRGNYLQQNIGLTEGMRDREYRDRTAASERDFQNQSAAYNRGMHRINVRQGLAQRAEDLGRHETERREDIARAADNVKLAEYWKGKEFGLKEREMKLHEDELAAMLKQLGSGPNAEMTPEGAASILNLTDMSPGDAANDIKSKLVAKVAAGEISPQQAEKNFQVFKKAADLKAQQQASAGRTLSEGNAWIGTDQFSVEKWADLVKRFRESKDDKTRMWLLDQINRINPAAPFSDFNSNLPDDIRKWREGLSMEDMLRAR